MTTATEGFRMTGSDQDIRAESSLATRNADDAELIRLSRSGDRDAFAAIVARYQALVCAVTYSGTGSFAASEDVAQETFIAAWKQLERLTDPAKLRPWLCGIARNLANNHRRRSGRATFGLDAVIDHPASEPTPHEQAVSREEEAILWNALEALPEQYREPLVLYYREQQSVERVAQELDLTSDATRQRLSRGRKLLQEQVTALIESTLRKTAPTPAFTMGVVAALPALKVSAAAAALGSTAAKGTAAAKAAALMGVGGGLLGGAIGLLGGWIGTQASIRNTQSVRERKFVVALSRVVWMAALAFCAALWLLVHLATRHWRSHPILIAGAMIALLLAYSVGLVTVILWANRRQLLIRAQETPHLAATVGKPFEYRSRCFLGLPLIHVRLGGQADGTAGVAKGWIAIGDRAYGVLLALGGIAVGAISCGGISAGFLSIGGIAFGVFSMAGCAFGFDALGGLAVGYVASGGGAIGWHAAFGGFALAREFAMGGLASAQHANDAAARSLFAQGNVRPAIQFLLNPWIELLLLIWMLWPLVWRARGNQRS